MKILLVSGSLILSGALIAQERVRQDTIAPVEMESVTILAPRKDVGTIVHLSGSEVLLRQQDLHKFDQVDGNQILQSQPGVYTQQEDGWGLRLNVGLRGTGVLRSSRITLMEDGVLAAPAPYSSPSAYYTPPFWKYQNIEILKGSAQLLAGPQTTGGAINLLTPVLDEKNDLKTQLAFGNFGQMRIGAQGEWKIAPRTSIGLGLNQSSAQGFKEILSKTAGGYRLRDGYLKIGQHLDEEDIHHLEFLLGYTGELSNQTYLGTTFTDAINDPYKMYLGASRDTMDMSRWLTRLSYTYNIKPGWFRVDVYQQKVNRNWYKLDKVDAGFGAKGISNILLDPNLYANEINALNGNNRDTAMASIKANNRAYLMRGVQARGQYTHNLLGQKVTHEAGLRLHFDSEDRFQWSDKYLMLNSEISLFSLGEKGAAGNRIDEASARSAYYRTTWALGNWTLQGGVRLEHIIAQRIDFGNNDAERSAINIKTQRNEVVGLLPGLSINKNLGRWWTAFGGLHKGFSPAGSKEGVLPEESLNTELGIKHRYFPVQLTIFNSDYSRLLGSDAAASGGTGEGSLYNGGSAVARGAEIRLGTGDKHWKTEISATYTDAFFTENFSSTFEEWGNIQYGDALPYIPKLQGMFQFSYNWEKVTVNWQTVYGGERKSLASSIDWDLPSSWVHNIGAQYALPKGFQLSGSIQNVFNSQHLIAVRPAGFRTYAPRMILIKLGWEL